MTTLSLILRGLTVLLYSNSFILVSHSSMVDAYSQQDEEVLKECTSDGIFRAMDPEVLNCMCKSTLSFLSTSASQ